MDYSNPMLAWIRRVGQRAGILRPLVRLYRYLAKRPYEDKFREEIENSIESGNVVWDVGANVGYYTALFLSKAGPKGRVIAFEPSLVSFGRLSKQFSECSNVVLQNVALAEFEGSGRLYISQEGVTDSLTRGKGHGADYHDVWLKPGDAFFEAYPPNIVKIDVEGHELEVLLGMSRALKSDNLRHVFLELHFALLNSRGLANGARQIVDLLEESGFRIYWIDPSHVRASRQPSSREGRFSESAKGSAR